MIALSLLLACAPSPAIALLAPSDGDVVCGEPLLVDVAVAGFELVDADAPVADGTGHIDVTLSGQDVMMGPEPPFEIYGMEDGVWELKVELVTNDHHPLDPPAEDAAQITIDNATCPEGTP